MAARVLERAIGEPYHAFAARRIFEPLGMASTAGGRTPPGPGSHGFRGGLRVDVPELTNLPGAGDLWSTVDDLARYAAAFDAGEILTESSRRAICTPHAPVPAEAGTPDGALVVDGYGYGYFVGTLLGRTMRYHTGEIPGYRSLHMRLADLDATVALLSNRDEADLEAIGQGLLPLVFGGSDES